jgi:hypothetical protein
VSGTAGRFRWEWYRSLTRRPDALFELTDAVLCAPGPVTSPPELSLAGVHRRGHGSTYAALSDGRMDVDRLRVALAGLRLPRGSDGPDPVGGGRDAMAAPGRRMLTAAGTRAPAVPCDGVRQTIPGWPYSIVAASPAFFLSGAGARLNHTNASKAFTTLLTAAGIRAEPKPRHTAAMDLLAAGVDASTITLWLGHASTKATSVYVHADMTPERESTGPHRATHPGTKRYDPPDSLLAFLENL